MPPNDSRSTSDMPSSSSTRRDIDRLDRTKADAFGTKIKFDAIEKDVDETKKIALSARKKAGEHSCIQEKRMEDVEQNAIGWTKWFRGILITVIGATIVLGTFLARLHFTKADDEDVQAVKEDVASIQVDVSDIQESQERIEIALEPKTQMELERKRIELYREMMKEVLVEAKADIKPTKNRNRRTN